MITRILSGFCLVTFLWLGFVTQATATTLPHRSLDQMVQEAAQIVRGKVLSKKAFWGPGKRHIYTKIQIQVLERLKGTKSTKKTMHFHQLGGSLDGLTSRILGAAEYRVGEEILIFLEPTQSSGFVFVLGFASGKYKVYTQGQKRFLHRDLKGLAFQRPGPQASPQHLQFSERPLQLQLFRQRVLRLSKPIHNLRALPPKRTPKQLKTLQLLRRHQQAKLSKYRPKNLILRGIQAPRHSIQKPSKPKMGLFKPLGLLDKAHALKKRPIMGTLRSIQPQKVQLKAPQKGKKAPKTTSNTVSKRSQ